MKAGRGMMRSVALALLASAAFAQPGKDSPFNSDEKWCGEESCYDVLGLKAIDEKGKATKRGVIKKTYFKLSKQWHPDQWVSATKAEQEEAATQQVKIARANEILTSTSKREKYDKYLRMKKQMDSPKENILVVVAMLALVALSIVHLYKVQLYQKLRKEITSDKMVANILVSKFGAAGTGKKSRKEKIKARRTKKPSSETQECGYSDEQINEALEAVPNPHGPIIVPGWEGSPSIIGSLMGTLWLPFGFMELTYTNMRWLVVYGILRSEYSDIDCEYLCYTEYGMSSAHWSLLDNDEKLVYLTKGGKGKPYNKQSLKQKYRAGSDDETDKKES